MPRELSQGEADILIALRKEAQREERINLPTGGESLDVPLLSTNRREKFVLGIWRARRKLSKMTLTNRGREIIMLVRLDLDGAPHTNHYHNDHYPDEETIGCPHLHVYREGYGDTLAILPPQDVFRDLSDPYAALEDFMQYCNVVRFPIIERELFP